MFYLVFPNNSAKWKELKLNFMLIGKDMEGIAVGYALLGNFTLMQRI